MQRSRKRNNPAARADPPPRSGKGGTGMPTSPATRIVGMLEAGPAGDVPRNMENGG